jgi:hypothetical protein
VLGVSSSQFDRTDMSAPARSGLSSDILLVCRKRIGRELKAP